MQTRHVLFVGDADQAAGARAHIILPPPKVASLHELFAETILEDTSTYQRRSALDWLVSVGIHFLILALLLILPLYFTTRLDFQKLNLTFLAAPATHLIAPPVAPMTHSNPLRPARVVPARVLTPGQLTMPAFIPKVIATVSSSAVTPPDEPLMGIPGGMPGEQVAGLFGGATGNVLKDAPPPAAPPAEKQKSPVFLGANVKPPRLLFGPEPVYPILARQVKLSGIVVIEAIIDEQGKVTGMRVISGFPILIPAALSAVSKRRYEPTIVNGQPTSIDLKLEISFNFS
jgi:TonB family protein